MGTFHCYLSLPERFSWWSFSKPWEGREDIPTASCEFGTKTQVEQLRSEGDKRGEVSSDGMGWHLKVKDFWESSFPLNTTT